MHPGGMKRNTTILREMAVHGIKETENCLSGLINLLWWRLARVRFEGKYPVTRITKKSDSPPNIQRIFGGENPAFFVTRVPDSEAVFDESC